MSKSEKQAYLKAIRKRYWNSNRAGKQAILDEFCAVCGYHRKSAIRLLRGPIHQKKPKRTHRAGRKPVYHTPAIRSVLKRLWLLSGQLCSKRLQVALPLWLPYYGSVG